MTEPLDVLHALAVAHQRAAELVVAKRIGQLTAEVAHEMATRPEVAFDVRCSTQVDGIHVEVSVQLLGVAQPHRDCLVVPFAVEDGPPL